MKARDSQERRLGPIFLFIPLAFAIIVASYSWHVNGQLSGDYAAVTHSYCITNTLEALMNRVTDGETGERGYLITGDEVYLEPYVLFTSTIEDIYASLGNLTADDPVQRRQVALLRPLLDARKAELQSMIELRRSSGLLAARSSASFGLGKALHDAGAAGTQLRPADMRGRDGKSGADGKSISRPCG